MYLNVKFILQNVMYTLLFYVSTIFKSVVILHYKLGSKHNHEDNWQGDINPSRERLIDDHENDAHSTNNKRPLIHLKLLKLFPLVVCLLTPDKK